MSLRQAAQAAGRQLRGRAAALQLQQSRNAGNLPVKPNKYVEQWGTMREHVENDFRWDGKTLARLAVFVGLVPALVWKATIAEFDHVDRSAGRSQRQMLGSSE